MKGGDVISISEKETNLAEIKKTKIVCRCCAGTGTTTDAWSIEYYKTHVCQCCKGKGYFFSTERRTKHLCLGGPLAGQFLTPEKASGYSVYNRAEGRGGGTKKTVLVWEGLLREEVPT